MTKHFDLARQGLTLTAALAQTALPLLLTPSFPRDEQPPDVMQPAGYTFAVWLPIFASSVAHGIDQARPARAADPVLRATDWPLAAAFSCTAAWAPLVATRRHWAAQTALVGIATFSEIARRRVAAANHDRDLQRSDRVALLPSAAMLSAWGSAAATVNLTAMLVDREVVRAGHPATVMGVVATLAAGALSVSTAAATPGGSRAPTARVHTATSMWALIGIAIGQRRRSRAIAAAAVVAALCVGVNGVRPLDRYPGRR